MIATLNSDGNDEPDSYMTPPLDSRQVRAFCALARTGSFTKAARELHLTQSGVSHSMKALETDIGCRLLNRMGKKVVLTQAGEQFLHHSKKILQEMAAARETLGHLGKWGKGRLRIGASTTACQQHYSAGIARSSKKVFRNTPSCWNQATRRNSLMPC